MLDDLLPLVKKPIRYTGGEYNIAVKTDPSIRVGVVFPDVYEIGMSNLGIKIIYHLFNQQPNLQCERIFTPWPDFGEKIRQHNIPLYGLETKRPAIEFDLLGFSLQSELGYTTVLYTLELAKIPFKSTARNANHPILLAGGPATLNPTPLSAVFDAFVIGDGEDLVPEIARILTEVPRDKKDQRLQELAKLSGVWVPQIHHYNNLIKKRTVSGLYEDTLPTPAILPICDIVHDRLGIEVMRGCTWGCRFCQAGYANRPLRIRPEPDILKAVERGIRETGWEEVALLAFSILDYPDLINLTGKLNEILKKRNVSISLPAMRGELFSERLAMLLKEIKKTGLTFAPETASDELRSKINKPFSNDRIISSINTAYQLGWKQVKLYFMLGLPFERDEDIQEINRFIREILKTCPKGSIKLAIAPFVPKAHTPFEGTEFASIELLLHKINQLKKDKHRRVAIRYRDPGVSFIEAVLARGDAALFPVIEEVYHQGARFEEWREGFDLLRWQQAFERFGIDPKKYLVPKEEYPWDFIDIGVKKEFLKEEFTRAQRSIITENCYYHKCANCGACTGTTRKYQESAERYLSYGRYPKRSGKSIAYRVKYSIGEPFRYASHLDITRTIYRALRRSDLPILFTQGFSPIPKVSFCPPKSVGQIAKADLFDFYLAAEYFGNLTRELNMRFPPGIRILDVRSLPAKIPSLSSSINLIYYEATIPPDLIKELPDLKRSSRVYIKTASGTKDLLEMVETLSLKNGVLTCGLYYGPKTINIYELLSYLTDLSLEQVRLFKVTRTAMFIKKEGLLYSPMEVK